MLGSRHLVHDDEGIIVDGDFVGRLHGFAVCELEYDLAGNGGGGGGYLELILACLESFFLTSEGNSGDKVEVGSGNHEGVTGGDGGRGDAYYRRMHEGESDGAALAIVHHEGDITFDGGRRDTFDGDLAFSAAECRTGGSHEIDAGHQLEVAAADFESAARLDGNGADAEAGRPDHGHGTGVQGILCVGDEQDVAALGLGRNVHADGSVALVQGESGGVKHYAALEDELLDHIEEGSLNNCRLAGTGILYGQGCDRRLAYLDFGEAVDEILAVGKDGLAGDGVGRNGDRSLVAGGACIDGDADLVSEDDLGYQVHIITGDGDHVARHSLGGAEGLEHYGLDVSDLALGEEFLLAGNEFDFADLGPFGRKLHADLGRISTLHYLDVGDGRDTGHLHGTDLIEVAAVEAQGGSTHHGVRPERYQFHFAAGILVGVEHLLLASCEQQETDRKYAD